MTLAYTLISLLLLIYSKKFYPNIRAHSQKSAKTVKSGKQKILPLPFLP